MKINHVLTSALVIASLAGVYDSQVQAAGHTTVKTKTVSLGNASLSGKQMEKLDRGVVAINTGKANFISWRLLGTDPDNISFNIYRGQEKLNRVPQQVTNYTDDAGTPASSYTIRPVIDGAELLADAPKSTWSNLYKTIPVQKPADGITPDGSSYSYVLNDGSAADLDGDGEYELIVKWQPTNAKDNSQAGYTGNTYVDAYKLDGKLLWRIDLGKNIRAWCALHQLPRVRLRW